MIITDRRLWPKFKRHNFNEVIDFMTIRANETNWRKRPFKYSKNPNIYYDRSSKKIVQKIDVFGYIYHFCYRGDLDVFDSTDDALLAIISSAVKITPMDGGDIMLVVKRHDAISDETISNHLMYLFLAGD